ncbi:hypothetical protein [Cycloclasticus pugetii]|jgi:hypothetical protein|uniref:hypothetical protein n=1 Tax=Cycloclasticus pugetii TaxID=34068 RepID=UPI003A8D7CC5
MSRKLPESLGVDEAVALMMSMGHCNSSHSIYDELGEILHDAKLSVHEYKAKGVESCQELELLERMVGIAKDRCNQAQKIKDCLYDMGALATAGEKSPLIISSKSTANTRFTTQSIVNFAQSYFGITIETQALPPISKRAYKSVLLDILDAAIDEHWGDGTLKRKPTNPMIESWIASEYPDIHFSKQLLTGFCKIIRPDEHRTASEREAIFKN